MADTELAELRKKCLASLYLCTDNVGKYMDTEKQTQLGKLKKYVQQYCQLETQQKVSFDALEKAKRETDRDNIDSLEERYRTYLLSMAGKRLNVNMHPFMTEFNKRVEKGNANARQNLDESDLAITESVSEMIDPITKRPIKDPVKNSICGHIYEQESIMKMISMKNSTRCPVAGCGNKRLIKADMLQSDEELKFRMALTQHSTMIQDNNCQNLDDSME